MEVNELIIGDWVEETMVGKHQWLVIDYPDFDEKYVHPIPLTKDILKANGFDGRFLWIEDKNNPDTDYVEMEYTEEKKICSSLFVGVL